MRNIILLLLICFAVILIFGCNGKDSEIIKIDLASSQQNNFYMTTKTNNESEIHNSNSEKDPNQLKEAENLASNMTKEKTSGADTKNDNNKELKLIMFHNGKGPMCLDQLNYLQSMKSKYPSLVVEEHLTTNQGERELMYKMENSFNSSMGISNNFGYLPITFINNHAYSGFNKEVKLMIEEDIKEASEQK